MVPLWKVINSTFLYEMQAKMNLKEFNKYNLVSIMVVLVSDVTLHEINNIFKHLDVAETSADFTSWP